MRARTLVLLALLLAAADAAAYTTITSPPSTWASSRIPVPWYLNQNGSADIGIDGTEGAVTASFNTWQAVDCCAIAFDYRGRSTMTAASSRGSNVVSWSESSWSYGGSALAVTQDWFGRSTIEESDIDCNGVNHTWNLTGSGGGVDTQSILTHEIGHFIGLGDLYDAAHSSSTMYGIYSGGTGSRSLAEDDMAGCRYLYDEPCGTPDCTVDTDCPTGYHCESGSCVRNTGTGGMCDPCTAATDCSDGLCLSGFPDGGTYCGVNCTTDADCGTGNTCYPVSGGPSQCAPTSGDCSSTPVGCTTDSECGPGRHCEGGTCVPDATGCTVDSDCPAGQVCNVATGDCYTPEPTLRGFGEPCGAGTECGSGVCLDGYCSRTCDPFTPTAGCPDGYYCDDVACGQGQCRRGGPGTAMAGDGCGSDGDCESAYCDTTTGAGVCMVPCNPMVTLGQCQYGEACQPLRTSGCGVCLCGPGMLGDFCASDLDCLFGLCRVGGDGVSRCTTECDGGRCPAGATCQSVEGYDGLPEQRCVATGQRAGGECLDNRECQSGNCYTYSNTRFCTRPCGGICDCPRSMSCVTVSTGEGWCVPSELAGGDGCGCRAVGGATGGGLLALLGLSALVVLRLRRRRA